MHEMSLAQSIVEIVENTAQQNQASSVVAVKLIIGELAGVEMHALMPVSYTHLTLPTN